MKDNLLVKSSRKTMLIAAIGCLAMFSCSKETETPEQPDVPDTAKIAGTNWVPARAVKIKDTSYTFSKVIPKKDASGKLIYDKANSETKQGKGYMYYDEKFKVVYVVDWPGIPGNAAEGAAGFKPFLFNFEKRFNVTEAQAAAGAAWDIKFYDIYTAYILPNKTGATGDQGKLRVYRTTFDELDEALNQDMVRGSVEIEMDDHATVDGWGRYRLTDHILHPYDRTIVFRLLNGKYVKFQLMNLYRTNPQTVTDKYEYEAPFYNFKYYIQDTPNSRVLKTR